MPSITLRRPHYYAWGLGAQAMPISLTNPGAIAPPAPVVGTNYAAQIAASMGQPPAICLDQNQNTIDCADPDCTYGDCGSTAPQLTSGSLCLDQSENQIACNSPDCTYGDCTDQLPPAAQASAGSGAPPAGVPTGTQLTYTATIAASLTASTNQATILSYINGVLGGQGLQVTSSNFVVTGLTTFNVTLGLMVTGSGFAQASDVKSIVDHAFYTQMGQLPMSSNITVGGPGGMQNWAAMLEGNMPWILLGLAAVVVLPAVVKKL